MLAPRGWGPHLRGRGSGDDDSSLCAGAPGGAAAALCMTSTRRLLLCPVCIWHARLLASACRQSCVCFMCHVFCHARRAFGGLMPGPQTTHAPCSCMILRRASAVPRASIGGAKGQRWSEQQQLRLLRPCVVGRGAVPPWRPPCCGRLFAGARVVRGHTPWCWCGGPIYAWDGEYVGLKEGGLGGGSGVR